MCVQRAMSMVQDTGEGGIGITNRISLILSCLQQTDDFAIGIGRLLGLLLLEKENSSFPIKVQNWLPLKAAAINMIQKTGTLRRACLQIFENELSPILAGLIAVLDTNKNINILGERDTWQFNLWIRMLNRHEIFDLTYQDVVRESKDTEQADFIVYGTGFEGYIFQSKMPFSWLIYRKISEILKCDSTFLGQIDGTASRAVFGDSPIMEELSTVPSENHEQAIDCYIVDFVNMIYSSREDEEMTVRIQMD
ncbi:E3 ubiquitin-protein ligase rnf213-alpha-like [Ruditapes philippinarum]|uniref:E3 ubiquitin-protein ligase rnf213-alpha-like n=1 Tax=Ruditapes philippinarum TaxID=129788 RepID=UPI00295C2658|nr:E3 ubiquitin-protein ligase rnf213-alpha-like [Ruditapes philippinarum]